MILGFVKLIDIPVVYVLLINFYHKYLFTFAEN